ncbi:MAG: hypothetical protein PVG66_05325 [Chromatiales bacterium]|jgi:DNA-binding NarL/FixJ family response regulator
MAELLSIIELGGYPNFTPLYQSLGFQVTVLNSQRKARNHLKKHRPDVIVCEYNFQTDFRDRTSNLETLLAILQKMPQVKLIVFYMPEHEEKFNQVRQRFGIHTGIAFPIREQALHEALQQATA